MQFASLGCPPLERLIDFVQGMTDASEEEITKHVTSCPRCLKALNRWHSRPDAWTRTLRAADAERASADNEEPVLQALLTDLKQRLTATTVSGTPPLELGQELRLLRDQGVLQSGEDGNASIGQLGEYRLLRLIGAGGMGLVFEGEDLRLGRRAAVKVIRPALAICPSTQQRFLREARLIAALDHDHVVAVYQAGEENGVAYFAMPLLKGETLESRLQRESRLAPQAVCSIGCEIVAGLAAAHAQGLVHRDLKPANIWLDPRVKLLDFGLARLIESERGLTGAGAVPGTPGYLAPEVIRGEPATPATDLFAVGCILYRALTGKGPLPTNIYSAVMSLEQNSVAAPKEIVPGIPADLSDLVMRLLDKSPEGRPESAVELGRALEQLPRPGGLAGAVGGNSPAAAPRRRRLSKRSVSLLLLLPAVSGGLALLNFGRDRVNSQHPANVSEAEVGTAEVAGTVEPGPDAEMDDPVGVVPEAWTLITDERFSWPSFQRESGGNFWGVEQGFHFDELGPGRLNATAEIELGPRGYPAEDLAVEVRFRCFHASLLVTLRRIGGGLRRESTLVLDPDGSWALLRRSFVTDSGGRLRWRHEPLPIEMPSEPLRYAAGEWAELRMEAVGERVMLYLNGRLIGDALDSEQHATEANTDRGVVAVGLISRTDGAGARREIDRVRIWELSGDGI